MAQGEFFGAAYSASSADAQLRASEGHASRDSGPFQMRAFWVRSKVDSGFFVRGDSDIHTVNYYAGFCDIVDRDKSGLLVESTKGGLAQALIAVAQDKLLRERLEAGARLAAKLFDISMTVERTVELYRRLLDEDHYQEEAQREFAARQGRAVGRCGRMTKSRLSSMSRTLWRDERRGH